MIKRREKDKEILEIYLVNLLLAYRHLLWVVGVLLLIYAGVSLSLSGLVSVVSLVVSLLFFLPMYSYKGTVQLAKWGVWLGTVGRRDKL